MLESPQPALYKETTKPNLQRMSDTNNAVFVDMIGISTAHPRHMAFYFGMQFLRVLEFLEIHKMQGPGISSAQEIPCKGSMLCKQRVHPLLL
jgi:hypothetical protein